MRLIELFELAAHFNLWVTTTYVARKKYLADTLSRNNASLFLTDASDQPAAYNNSIPATRTTSSENYLDLHKGRCYI